MAKKKNRVAAGQERARQRARKKARYAGPAPAPDAPPPAETDEALATDAAVEAEQPTAKPQPAPAASAPAQTRRVSAGTAREVTSIGATRQRQTSQAISVASGPPLWSELLRIGSVTLVVAAILVVLFFTTELGG